MGLLTEETAKKIIAEKGLKPGDLYQIKQGEMLTPSAKAYFTERNISVGISGEKPEHMTHLRANILVEKDNPRIEFRGMIDYLESEIIRVQLRHSRLKEDLQEVIRFIRHLLRCEVSGEAVGEFTLLGLDAAGLREHSHHTTKHYGVKHFLPSCEYGETVADLNLLRTLTRRVELAAYRALKNDNRNDIIKGLNRLSSLFWIMMVKEVGNGTDSK